MATNPRFREFVERAQTGGVSEQSVVGILTACAWPEKEVYEALTHHYEQVVGVEIPRRRNAGTAAKDAFLYLLSFSTLATWTIAMVSPALTLIDILRNSVSSPSRN